MTEDQQQAPDTGAAVPEDVRAHLRAWVEEVARGWREWWKTRTGHRYADDFPAYLGERLLTDFNLRDLEPKSPSTPPPAADAEQELAKLRSYAEAMQALVNAPESWTHAKMGKATRRHIAHLTGRPMPPDDDAGDEPQSSSLAFAHSVIERQAEELKMVGPVVRAIEDEGPRPDIHRAAIARLQRDWPTLWAALEALVRAHRGQVQPKEQAPGRVSREDVAFLRSFAEQYANEWGDGEWGGETARLREIAAKLDASVRQG